MCVRSCILAAAITTAFAAQASARGLDGTYAYFQARTSALQARGPRNDADCRAFFASPFYEAGNGEVLNIAPGRWSDDQDVSAVTGRVQLGTAKGLVTPFVIHQESEGRVLSRPVKGTVTRLGEVAITVKIEGKPLPLHYCRLD